jgi:oligopeptidase B
MIITSCGGDNMNKPNPKKIPFELNQHGDLRIDNYYWMRDDTRSDTEIIEYL